MIVPSTTYPISGKAYKIAMIIEDGDMMEATLQEIKQANVAPMPRRRRYRAA